jgi:hypothetical protein
LSIDYTQKSQDNFTISKPDGVQGLTGATGPAGTYTASSGVVISNSDIYMGGTGNLNQLQITSISSDAKPLIVKAAVSQTTNLIEAQSSSGTILFSVNNSGYIATPSSGLATWNASQLKGYPVSGNVPATGQVLTWDGNSWYAADITARGDHIIGDIYASPSGNIFTGNVLLNGAISGVLPDTNLTTIDFTPYSSGDCVKYIVKAKYGNSVQASEILITSDGVESYMTEYGLIFTSGLLANLSTNFSSQNIILSAKATNSNTSIHMFKTLIS